jgi:hypothetical protein
VGAAGFDALEGLAANPRQIELVILKQRNGSVGSRMPLSYYPRKKAKHKRAMRQLFVNLTLAPDYSIANYLHINQSNKLTNAFVSLFVFLISS